MSISALDVDLLDKMELVVIHIMINFQLNVLQDNSWIARDPGTGTYTDDIDLRNKFKSLDYHWGPQPKMKFPKEDEFDCFKLNYMTSGEVLKFDKNNFFGFADFNGKRIYRKIQINDGVVSIEDFSKDVELEEYTSWGEENNGIKVQFSNGYKRIRLNIKYSKILLFSITFFCL